MPSNHQSPENRRKWIPTCTSHICCIIYVKFGTVDLCIMQFRRSEFSELCAVKKHTLLGGVNEFLSLFSPVIVWFGKKKKKNFANQMLIKSYCVAASFIKISTLKTTFCLGACKNIWQHFSSYCLIWFKFDVWEECT